MGNLAVINKRCWVIALLSYTRHADCGTCVHFLRLRPLLICVDLCWVYGDILLCWLLLIFTWISAVMMNDDWSMEMQKTATILFMHCNYLINLAIFINIYMDHSAGSLSWYVFVVTGNCTIFAQKNQMLTFLSAGEWHFAHTFHRQSHLCVSNGWFS